MPLGVGEVQKMINVPLGKFIFPISFIQVIQETLARQEHIFANVDVATGDALRILHPFGKIVFQAGGPFNNRSNGSSVFVGFFDHHHFGFRGQPELV